MCPETTLITLTRGYRSSWFEAMERTVPPGVEHLVVTVPAGTLHDDWAKARFRALQEARTPYVGFLDDDDLLEPGAVAWCEQALTQTGAGIAFTHEMQVDEFGNELFSSPVRPVQYCEARIHPRTIHHLALFRKQAIPADALDIEQSFGCGFEWYIKARAAFDPRFSGARQIPRVGYRWRQHSEQYSKQTAWKTAFTRAQRGISNVLFEHSMHRETQQIPVFEPF
jgi:hypothetical protein